MAKFHGKIGFVTSERHDGIYEYSVVERTYRGDILQNHRRWDQKDKILDDLDISNRISLISDDFIVKNLGTMKYVEFMHCLWEIKSVDISYPRIILLLGGVYNGPQASTAE